MRNDGGTLRLKHVTIGGNRALRGRRALQRRPHNAQRRDDQEQPRPRLAATSSTPPERRSIGIACGPVTRGETRCPAHHRRELYGSLRSEAGATSRRRDQAEPGSPAAADGDGTGGPALLSTLTVTNTDDGRAPRAPAPCGGPSSRRITAACPIPSFSSLFDTPQTIVLTQGPLTLEGTATTTIAGPGAIAAHDQRQRGQPGLRDSGRAGGALGP